MNNSASNDDTARNPGKGLTAFRLDWPAKAERWDAFVRSAALGNAFASSGWLRAAAEAHGMEVDIWVISKGAEWFAGLPLLSLSRYGRKVCPIVPQMPYTSIIYGPLALRSSYPSSNTAEHLSLSKALIEAVSGNYASVTLSLLPGVQDVRPWMWAGWSVQPSYTYCLDLALELRSAHSVRKNSNKFTAAGSAMSLNWDLEAAWSTMRSTVRRQGVGIGMTKETFFDLANKLHEDGLAWMATARTAEGEAAAARIQLALEGTDTVYDWVAGSTPEGLSAGANPWLMLQIAGECRRRGFRQWNLCGAQFENVAKFKSELGGDLVHGFQVVSPRSFLEWGHQEARKLGSRALRYFGWRRR